MKVSQYMNAEKAIVSADGGGIRQRWQYGLRLLRDPESTSPNGNGESLRHGVTQLLIDAAAQRGLKLSDRELRYRLQCARAYQTESQIGNAIADFGSWFALTQAQFPAYEAEADEPLADHRTSAERDHDQARQMLLAVGPQASLFPLAEFEPTQATLKDLLVYADEQDQITERFANRGRERRAYLNELMQAVDHDANATWQDAHERAFGEQQVA